jgi:gas vesicle protein
MTTVYLIGAIVALVAILMASLKISAGTKKRLKNELDSKQKSINDLRDLVLNQEDEIRKYNQMIETMQEIEIDHIKKSKTLRTPSDSDNVRNASDIMRDLQAGADNSNKNGPSS